MRITFFAGIWSLGFVLAASLPAGGPNIILCMADDLGWGDVGFNGNRLVRTPHLDAMAEDGLTFTRFYAAAPVCSPTRGSCLTGRHPFRYGIFGANVGHIRTEEQTLAELLKDQGYITGHFGKWHLGTLTKTEKDSNRGGPRNKRHFAPPTRHGFDHFFSTEAKVPTWDPMIRPRNNPSRTHWDPITNPELEAPFGTAYWTERGKVSRNLRGDDSRVIMDRVIPFLRSAVEKQQPFFAVIWFHAPHLPVVAGPKYTRLYPNQTKHAQHYFGCITAMDEQIGRLRAELRELNIDQNTLLTFCADNGPEGDHTFPGSAGPFRGRKRSLFEGGIRVPGLIVWPRLIAPGRTTDFPACTSDYLPTIRELLGLTSEPAVTPLDGLSLLPVLKGKQHERTAPIGFQFGKQSALITQRYKLIYPGKKRPKGQSLPDENSPQGMLFDLLNDPGESNNLAAKHPEIVAAMRQTLIEWQASCQDSLAGKDSR